MSENFRSFKAREIFTHKWKPNNQEFCFELRKKKRVQDLNRRRFLQNSAKPNQSDLFQNEIQYLDLKIKETQSKSLENFSQNLEQLLDLASKLFFINFESFMQIFDMVVGSLQTQSHETIDNRVNSLSSLFLKINPPHEGELIISKKFFSSLFQDSTFLNEVFFKFLLLLVQNKKLKQLKEFCDFLDEVHTSGSEDRLKWIVVVISELSKNNSICEVLSSELFKLVLDGLISPDQGFQTSSLSIIEKISAESDTSKYYLLEIGVVNILSSLLVISRTSIQIHTIIILNNLLQTDTDEILKSLLTNSLISSIFYIIQTKFVALARPLSKLLYDMTDKSILFNIEILKMLADSDLFPILTEVLLNDSSHLTGDFLNFLDNILYLSTNSLKLQDFIESGCYFALEHCTLTSNEDLSCHIQYILKSYFE